MKLRQLRVANEARQEEWNNGKEVGAGFRALELGGEVGEALNIVKKIERERLGIKGSRATIDNLADELADVLICVDLLASEYGIDLVKAVVRKFNETSFAHGFKTRLTDNDEQLPFPFVGGRVEPLTPMTEQGVWCCKCKALYPPQALSLTSSCPRCEAENVTR